MTYTEAISEIYKTFFDYWKLKSPTVCNYCPQVFFANHRVSEKPPIDKHWCRISIQTVRNEQSTFRGPKKENFGLRYTNYGLVFVQLFFAKTALRFDQDSRLAEIAQDAFIDDHNRGKIWFRDSRIQEVPEELDFFRANVIAEYQFDCIYN